MNYKCNGIEKRQFRQLWPGKGKKNMAANILWIVIFARLLHKATWCLRWSRDASSVIFLYLPLYILHGATSLWQVKVIAPFSLSYLMYILFISVYICTCVWTRESKRERASNMFSQFSCVGTQMNTNIVYQFLYFTLCAINSSLSCVCFFPYKTLVILYRK